jgi:hypothetical protein
LQRPISVTTLRNLGLLAIAFGAVLVALSPRHRALVARRLAHTRRFVSRRVVDRDECRSQALDQALDTWNDDGGAKEEESNAAIR